MFIQRKLFLILIGLSFCLACESPSGTKEQEGERMQKEKAAVEGESLIDSSEIRSRGSGSANARLQGSPQERYAQLFELVANDLTLKEKISQFISQVESGAQIQTETAYKALISIRDEEIIPALESLLLNLEPDQMPQDRMSKLEPELNALGMTLIQAEGMVVGLGAKLLLPGVANRVASADFKAFLDFQQADAAAQNGEYPYMNLAPYEEMVVTAEKLMDHENEYWPQIEERFFQALTAISDVHLLQNEGARDGGTPLVGGIHTDFWPYAAEIESLKDFGERFPESRYSKAVQRIAQNPSSFSAKPENIYVVVIEWLDEEEQAQRKVMRYLGDGADIPHYLPIVRGDGTVRYAVAYRFYEDDQKADEALQAIEGSYPEARLIFCSVKGEKLYQLGPMAD